MGKLVNKAELSQILGVSQQSLTAWQEEDPPLPIKQRGARRGQSNAYDTADVIQWWLERRLRESSAETPRDRLATVQAQEIELRIAEKRGQLVSVEHLEPELGQMLSAFRSELLARDTKLVSAVNVLYGIQIDQQLIEDHTHAALRQLARYNPERAGFDASPGEATGSAGKDHDNRVGETSSPPIE